jgi:hypothetical protein
MVRITLVIRFDSAKVSPQKIEGVLEEALRVLYTTTPQDSFTHSFAKH